MTPGRPNRTIALHDPYPAQIGVQKTAQLVGRGHVMSLLGRFAVVGVLFCMLAGPASAAPCWKNVTLDWAADGSVDKTYPVECYHEAIVHLPQDLVLYSSANDDIQRALQRVVAGDVDQIPPVQSASDGDSIPLPLLALGGLALLLVTVGVVGIVRRRLRGERPSTP